MVSPLRLELAGALYHVTSRGDGREGIYRSDEDRVAWLDTLGQVCERFNVELAWHIVDSILGMKTPIHEYEPASWSPKANAMIAEWRLA